MEKKPFIKPDSETLRLSAEDVVVTSRIMDDGEMEPVEESEM